MSDEYILKADAIAIAESYNVEGFNLNDYEYGRDQVASSIASDLEDVKPADVAPIIYGEWVIPKYSFKNYLTPIKKSFGFPISVQKPFMKMHIIPDHLPFLGKFLFQ